MHHTTLAYRNLLSILLATLSGWAAHAASNTPASASSAYRCTDAHGHVSYSQQACSTGTDGKLVSTKDARTDGQRQQAQKAMQRDKALAHDLSWQSRLQQDHAAHQGPANLSGPVRQVAVGQREANRQGVTTAPTKRNARHFRAKTPSKSAKKSNTQNAANAPSIG
jgi:hypothetical protein